MRRKLIVHIAVIHILLLFYRDLYLFIVGLFRWSTRADNTTQLATLHALREIWSQRSQRFLKLQGDFQAVDRLLGNSTLQRDMPFIFFRDTHFAAATNRSIVNPIPRGIEKLVWKDSSCRTGRPRHRSSLQGIL